MDAYKANLLLSSFPGRDDCYGAGKGACVKKPLTEAVILRHVLGRERIGRYLLRKDGGIGVLVVDIDENDLNPVIEYCNQCGHYGLTAHVERSKSGNYHAWWFLSGLVPAKKARLVANHILGGCGLLDDVEIFPKQDFLEHGMYGNYINLPEFGRDVIQGRTVFLDPETGYKPYRDQWAFLASERAISEAQLNEVIEINNLALGEVLSRGNRLKQGSGAGMFDKQNGRNNNFLAPPCLRRLMAEGVPVGLRNESSFRISIMLYRAGIPEELGRIMLWHWNSKNRPPLPEDELDSVIHQGYSGHYNSYGCRNLEEYCSDDCPIYQYRKGKGWR